jgi:hypothetical protein
LHNFLFISVHLRAFPPSLAPRSGAPVGPIGIRDGCSRVPVDSSVFEPTKTACPSEKEFNPNKTSKFNLLVIELVSTSLALRGYRIIGCCYFMRFTPFFILSVQLAYGAETSVAAPHSVAPDSGCSVGPVANQGWFTKQWSIKNERGDCEYIFPGELRPQDDRNIVCPCAATNGNFQVPKKHESGRVYNFFARVDILPGNQVSVECYNKELLGFKKTYLGKFIFRKDNFNFLSLDIPESGMGLETSQTERRRARDPHRLKTGLTYDVVRAITICERLRLIRDQISSQR